MGLEVILEENSCCPLIAELPANLSPAGAFELIQGQPFCFFLDSSMDLYGLGRFSFLGCDPFVVLRSRGTHVSLTGAPADAPSFSDPFQALAWLSSTYRTESSPVPVPFQGGMVGYLGFDLCHFLEQLPCRARDDLHLPEAYFGCYDVVLCFDQVTGKRCIVSSGWPERDPVARRERAAARLSEMEHLLSRRPPRSSCNESYSALSVRVNATFSHPGYVSAVSAVREYIAAGDIFQVNLSQRFDVPLSIPPAELYRRLRRINPAPFAAYLDFDGLAVVSASPERYLRLQGDRVETRPMKGTRPRGKTPAEDEALAWELVASIKDRAENVMIVDLERNDLGRVCRYGSVKVRDLFTVEKYATVFQLTSTVEGRLAAGKGAIDLLRGAFPGGSITGAPKVRAMEIIDELEPTRRGIYTGAIGYLGFNGDMDLNIAIRTFIVKEGRAYFQVGGGIVYDSDPEGEYRETLDKAQALAMSLGLTTDDLKLEQA